MTSLSLFSYAKQSPSNKVLHHWPLVPRPDDLDGLVLHDVRHLPEVGQHGEEEGEGLGGLLRAPGVAEVAVQEAAVPTLESKDVHIARGVILELESDVYSYLIIP